ncbi:MAG: hypothetical protein IT349_15145 [Candidatus Eisenbacteria bacterium]|nr:hypothetical protein [Candidatus Eisenbacteria bacterium]
MVRTHPPVRTVQPRLRQLAHLIGESREQGARTAPGGGAATARAVRAVFTAAAAAFLLPSGSEAAVRRVWPDGFGAYPNIQAAWNASASGDVIELEDGLFVGPGNANLALNGKSVTVQSVSGDPEACRIDCAAGPIGFSGGAAPRFEGIQFVHAFGCDAKKSDLQFVNCIFEAPYQVAIAIGGTSYQFEQCIIRRGQGLLFGDVEGTFAFSNCEFRDNLDTVASSVAMTFQDCLFTGNSTPDGSAVVDCYYLFYPQATTFSGCRLVDNAAPPIAAFDAFVILDRSLIAASTAPAVDFTVGFSGDVALAITNSTIADMAGGPAIRVRRTWDVLPVNVSLDRTIIAFTEGGAALECIDLAPGNVPSVSCCNLFGNSGGNYVGCLDGQGSGSGNLEVDPRFCSAFDRDYHLQETSPCVLDPTCGQIGAFGVGCLTAGVDPDGLEGDAPGSRWRLRAEPNPFRGEVRVSLVGPRRDQDPAAVGARGMSLQIVDAAGRVVRNLAGEIDASNLEWRWDGRDAAGRRAAAGVYYLRAATGRHPGTGADAPTLRVLRLP